MTKKVSVWRTIEEGKLRFWIGRKPGKSWGIAGEFVKLYNPDTGTTSENWSYQKSNQYAPQPTQKWLYDRMPA